MVLSVDAAAAANKLRPSAAVPDGVKVGMAASTSECIEPRESDGGAARSLGAPVRIIYYMIIRNVSPSEWSTSIGGGMPPEPRLLTRG